MLVTEITAPLQTLAAGFAITEAPRWKDSKLFFSDIFGHRVHLLGEDQTVETLAEFKDRPSGLGFMPNGDLLVVLMNTRKLVRLASNKTLAEHADLSNLANYKINDMAVDRFGRAYVSQHGCDLINGPLQTSALILVHPDGCVRVAADDLMTSNGIAISAEGNTLIVAETRADRLTAFRINDDGTLSNRRTYAELPANSCPDGICLDSDSGLWTACAAPGNPVRRIEEGGRITHTLHLAEGRYAYACELGGIDQQTLLLCTGDSYIYEDARKRRPAKIESVTWKTPIA